MSEPQATAGLLDPRSLCTMLESRGESNGQLLELNRDNAESDGAGNEIRSEQMALLIEQSYPAAYISLLVGALLVAILWPAQSHTKLLIWLGALLLAALLRLIVFRHYRRSPPAPEEVQSREKTYFSATLLYFLCWGVGGIWIMPADSPVAQITVFYFLIGLAGSAIAVFSASRTMQLSAVGALLIPILIWFFTRGDFHSVGMAVAGTIFFLSAIRSSRVLARVMRQNLTMKHRLLQAKAEAERLARVDELTGLFNRRAFYEYGDIQVAQARRSGAPLSLILLDVDFFKQINDEHGHTVGDRALQHVARQLTTSLRGSDMCGRVGGEEFAILLPDTDPLSAAEVAEFLRDKLEKAPFEYQGVNANITASFGVTQGSGGVGELIQQADTALYRAKESGRNRVECWDNQEGALRAAVPS